MVFPFFSAADADAIVALADFFRLRMVARPSPKFFSLDDPDEVDGRASVLLLRGGKREVRV